LSVTNLDGLFHRLQEKTARILRFKRFEWQGQVQLKKVLFSGGSRFFFSGDAFCIM
jgi:hypothetical protein